MPTPFVADAADEAVRSESILNERKAADIIEETALEVDIRAWRAEGLRLLQAASAREDKVPNGARRPCSVLGDASAQAAIEDAVTRMSRTEGVPQRPPRALGSTLAPAPEPPFIPKFRQRTLFFSTVALFFITLLGRSRRRRVSRAKDQGQVRCRRRIASPRHSQTCTSARPRPK